MQGSIPGTARSAAILAVLVALAVLACTATTAASAAVESSGGFKYVTKDFTLKPSKARTNRAACPKRTHVLSGGHYNNGTFGDVIGSHSYPYDGDDRDKKPDDGWAAQLYGFGVSYAASVYAICARTFPEYDKDEFLYGPGDVDKNLLTCDPNFLEITGGGSRGPASVREIEGYRGGIAPAGWFQTMRNTSDRDHESTLYSICANLTPIYPASSPVSAASQTQESAEVACPPQAPQVIGGGVERGDYETKDGAIAATRPSPNLGSWQVWVDNYDKFESFVVRARAICSPSL